MEDSKTKRSDSQEQHDWDAVFKRAEELEEKFCFHEAYREFARCGLAWIEAEHAERAYVAILRAGLNLEKSQVWRAHSALWEMLGNRLQLGVQVAGDADGEEYVGRFLLHDCLQNRAIRIRPSSSNVQFLVFANRRTASHASMSP